MVPFEEIDNPLGISSRLEFQARFNDALNKAKMSLGIFLALGEDLNCISSNPQHDHLLQKLEKLVEDKELGLDLRSKMSYALLFYATAKVGFLTYLLIWLQIDLTCHSFLYQ